MPPKEMTKLAPENDIEWCLKNTETLNFESFYKNFSFSNEKDAKRRYGNILSSQAFKGHEGVSRLKREFNQWKIQDKKQFQLEKEKEKLELAKQKATVKLQQEGLKNAEYFGTQQSRGLRRGRSDAESSDSNTDNKKQAKRRRIKEDEENSNDDEEADPNDEEANESEEGAEDDEGQSVVVEQWVLYDGEYLLVPVSDEQEGYYSGDEDDEPKSDLSINWHEKRNGDYNVLVEGEDDDEQEEELDVMLISPWKVGEVDVIHECDQFATKAIESVEDARLFSDMKMLALNRIFLFDSDVNKSVTAYFGPSTHDKIISTLGMMNNLKIASDKVYTWCSTCGLTSYNTWMDVQIKTLGYMNEAAADRNEFDLVIANLIHRFLPAFAINGSSTIGEDSYVHVILAPFLELTFGFEPTMNHVWANVNMQEKKDLKPDYAVFVNGLSKRFVVLVAEFKPPDGKERMESDLVKIGIEMKVMLNRLIKLGVENPAVGGILVNKNILSTFKLELKGPNTYSMTRLSSTTLFTTMTEFSLIPTIAVYLHQIKDIAKETATKVQEIVHKVNNGDPQHSNIPHAWMNQEVCHLHRTNIG